jgi:hypothetical protein
MSSGMARTAPHGMPPMADTSTPCCCPPGMDCCPGCCTDPGCPCCCPAGTTAPAPQRKTGHAGSANCCDSAGVHAGAPHTPGDDVDV